MLLDITNTSSIKAFKFTVYKNKIDENFHQYIFELICKRNLNQYEKTRIFLNACKLFEDSDHIKGDSKFILFICLFIELNKIRRIEKSEFIENYNFKINDDRIHSFFDRNTVFETIHMKLSEKSFIPVEFSDNELLPVLLLFNKYGRISGLHEKYDEIEEIDKKLKNSHYKENFFVKELMKTQCATCKEGDYTLALDEKNDAKAQSQASDFFDLITNEFDLF